MSYARVLCLTLLVTVVGLPLEAATATWDRNPEPSVTGYILSYGTQPGVHPTSINVGNVLTYQFFPPPGRYYAVVQAYDSSGTLSAKSAEVMFDVAGTANQPPSLTQPATQTSVQNVAVSLTLTATDPEGSAITYTASGLPPGLTISASSGVIAGTVTTQGTWTVTATASDGSLSASRTFTWTVTGSGTSTTVVLSPVDTVLSVETPTTNHIGMDRLQVMTSPDYRPGEAPLMRFDLSQIPANATIQSAALELTLIKADSISDPNYSVSLHQVINRNPDLTRATARTFDGTNAWTANTCCAGGHPMAQADISPARAVIVVDKTLGLKTLNALPLVQAWRSSPASNYGLILNPDISKRAGQYRRFASMEHFVVSQRPLLRVTYVVSGTAGDTTPPTVSVTAPANNATVSGNSVNVTATAADAGGVVGVQFRLDGVALGAEDTTAPYAVAWNSTTAANGSHQLTAVARDLAGNSRTSTAITVTVNNNRAPTLTQPANQTSSEGSAVSLALTASDPDGNALAYSASGLPAGLAINATSGLISGTPTYTSAGTYSVTATASDGSLSQSRTFAWTITNTNRAPSLTQPANQTSATGTAASLSLSASDPDGTAVTFTAGGLPPGLAINATSGVISGTPTQVGSYSVTATASDGSLSQSRTFSWTITSGNRAPTLTQPADQMSASNSDVSLQLSASDPDGTPLTYQATGLPPGATIDTSTGLISGRLTAGSAGLYSVTASVSDGALSATRTFSWSVDVIDTAVPGDYDGDGRDDPATYRRTTGEWRVWPSAGNFVAATPIVWGGGADLPVPADYDGDGRTDIGVYRPSTGRWYILLSSTNNQSSLEVAWGNGIDRPIAMDYDNDGRADLALPRFGGFDILLSGSNYTSSVTVR
jgi:hypothetical protein